MTWIFNPYTPILIFAALLSIGLIYLIWPRRDVPGVRFFIGYLAAVSVWTFFNGLEISVVEQPAKIFFNQIGYLGFVCVPPLLWLFSNEYTRQQTLSIRRFSIIWIIPAMTIVLAWTNPWHGWMWTGFSAGLEGTNVLIYHHGVWFWVNIGYVYAMILLTFANLVQAFLRFRLLFRWQAGGLILSLLFPLLTGTLYLLGWEPVKGLDISSLGFSLTGLFLAWNLTRLRMFDVIPLAKDVIIECMEEGVIVLDNLNRLIDLNPASEQITGISLRGNIGYPAAQVFKEFPGLIERLNNLALSRTELEIEKGQNRRYFDVSKSPIRNWRNQPVGQVIILHDTTEQKDLFNQVNQLATMDSLTGVFNRRYFMELGQKEVNRSLRYSQELSAVMMDIDLFKKINDSYGHQVGDEVLKTVAQTCQKLIRDVDIMGRYGGEEFVIILPSTGLKEAAEAAERLRWAIDQLDFKGQGARFLVTASFGVSSVKYNECHNLDELLSKADRAMYQAKREGRNRVATLEKP